MTEMNKIKKVMLAVMAALRAFGIEFDTNVSGFSPYQENLDLEHVVKYNMYKDRQNVEYLKGFHGQYWKLLDENKGVQIQFVRYIEPTEEEADDWANFNGYASYIEAQYAIGDMPWREEHLVVEVNFGHLDSFVNAAAPYCWANDN